MTNRVSSKCPFKLDQPGYINLKQRGTQRITMAVRKSYDVIIPGGGLAGLTLALQIKQRNQEISILVLEKRKVDAPVATHKVGESTSELGAVYLREKLQLAAYLDENQLEKFGLRFFFSPQHTYDISRRVEVGTRINNFYPTHQLDRGILENDLALKVASLGITVLLGAKVKDVQISQTGHEVTFAKEDVEYTVSGKWLVDATGRNSLLKRKFGLEKEMKHHINAAWFRLDSEIDIDYWSDNLAWRAHVSSGQRRLATNHLMGEGYWVWFIPLVSGATSIGIVADPVYHPFKTFNTYKKSMLWLQHHEPLAYEMLSRHQDKLMDFKVMKHLTYNNKQFFSTDKWAITGEAGAFMDPFYSPGFDFIGLGNTWISDLVVRDLKGEDVTLRTMIYELAMKELLNGWIHIYENMYGLFGKSQIMLMKIVWDWASYWGVQCVLFINDGYTNVTFLKQYSSTKLNIGKRFGKLNEKMQCLFKTWHKYEDNEYEDFCGNLFDLKFFRQLQIELSQKIDEVQLINKVESNVQLLEKVASEIFRKVSTSIHGTPIDMKVNPYLMSLEEGNETLITKSLTENTFAVDEQIKSDIEKMWLIPVKLKVDA